MIEGCRADWTVQRHVMKTEFARVTWSAQRQGGRITKHVVSLWFTGASHERSKSRTSWFKKCETLLYVYSNIHGVILQNASVPSQWDPSYWSCPVDCVYVTSREVSSTGLGEIKLFCGCAAAVHDRMLCQHTQPAFSLSWSPRILFWSCSFSCSFHDAVLLASE